MKIQDNFSVIYTSITPIYLFWKKVWRLNFPLSYIHKDIQLLQEHPLTSSLPSYPYLYLKSIHYQLVYYK